MESEAATATRKSYWCFTYIPASPPPFFLHVDNIKGTSAGELGAGSSVQLRLMREDKGKAAIVISSDDEEEIV